DAGTTPGRPEIQDQHLPTKVGERDGLPAEVLQGEGAGRSPLFRRQYFALERRESPLKRFIHPGCERRFKTRALFAPLGMTGEESVKLAFQFTVERRSPGQLFARGLDGFRLFQRPRVIAPHSRLINYR